MRVLAEKSESQLNLAYWAHDGGAYISLITASELLVGVERADTAEGRIRMLSTDGLERLNKEIKRRTRVTTCSPTWPVA